MCIGMANGGKTPKMTDKEIIQALEDWMKNFDGKAVDFITLNSALDLIKRQKFQLDNYSHNVRNMSKDFVEQQRVIYRQQAEIERLKGGADNG